MSSAIDEVLDNKQAQEFWLKRLIAVIIDFLIIYVPISVITTFAWGVGFYFQPSWLISGSLVVLYSALFETELGYTIGKRIMDLEVVSLDARRYDIPRGLVRNISKIHGIFLFIDLLIGLLGEDRVNMRYLDITTNSEVVTTEVAEWRRAHGLAPPPGDGAAPAPPVTVSPEGEPPEPTMPPEEAPEAPGPPAEDELQEVPVEEEGGAPGIAPPPIPPEMPEEPPEGEGDDELEEIEPPEEGEELEEIEAPPAYRMDAPSSGKGEEEEEKEG